MNATILRLIPISVVLLAGFCLSIWTHNLLTDHQALLVHTYEVIEATKDLLIAVDDAETGQRGYLLTGNADDLRPHARAEARLDRVASTLRGLVADNPAQIARLERVLDLIHAKMTELASAIAARDKAGFEAALSIVRASRDQATMDAIRFEIGQITHAEQALVASRGSEVRRDERRILVTAVLVGLISIATRTGVELFLARGAARRSRSAA